MFEVRIAVVADTPEEEFELVNAIASEFIRQNVASVTVIAGDGHVNYVNGEVCNLASGIQAVFRTDPRAPTESFVRGSGSIN